MSFYYNSLKLFIYKQGYYSEYFSFSSGLSLAGKMLKVGRWESEDS